MKKLISLFLTGVMVFPTISGVIAHADNDSENIYSNVFDSEYVYGDAILDPSYYNNDYEYIIEEGNDIDSINNVIPSSYDISTNPATAQYFPSIGNQGRIGSCTAFATTYYQFTYEVNKLRGISTTANNTYSPSWTYNYLNGGRNVGTFLIDAYKVLENQGAITLQDFPYDGSTESSYSYWWCTNEQKLIDALKYRASHSSIYVTSTTSTRFTDLKAKIAAGHVAVIETDALRWKMCQNTNGEYVIVQGGTYTDEENEEARDGDDVFPEPGGHCLTIVGYDNNYKIQVNGVTLKGAFKVANSWGNSWGQSGYVWISYDALNQNSIYGNTWNSDFDYPRVPIFNQFHFIDVNECDVYFAGIVTLMTNDRTSFNIMSQIGDAAVYDPKRSCIKQDITNPFYCYIAFDFFDFSKSYDLSDMLSTNLRTKISSYSNQSTYRINTRIYDNLKNPIVPIDTLFGSLPSNGGDYVKTSSINIAKGRVTAYDNNNITSYDSEMVLNYIVGNIEFSNLKKYLADYNDDNVVDILDVVAMNGQIAAQNGRSYSISDYIPEWNCSLSDVLESEYNISIDDFIANNAEYLDSINVVL